jgi:Ca-activated chloride channel homolog
MKTSTAFLTLLLCLSVSTVVASREGPDLLTAQQRVTKLADTLPPAPSPTPPLEPTEDIDVVKVSTTLVTVPMRVTDQKGKYVPDLRAEEFRVFEDGVEQQLAYFAPVESPFTVALMLDVSDSTESSFNQIKEAAAAFINHLRPDDDVIIITFDSRVNVVDQPTNDRKALREMIDQLRPGKGTRLYDALNLILKRLLNQIKGRKAIVLFTDGVDIDSLTTPAQTLLDVEEAEVLVYSVRYDTYAAAIQKARRANASSPTLILASILRSVAEDYAIARNYLKKLADKTGARMYEASSPPKLAAAFALIAEGLRAQYSLGYYPSTPPQPDQRRKIKIIVTRPKLVVHARDGYVFGALTGPRQPQAPK